MMRLEPPVPNEFGSRVLRAAKNHGFEVAGLVDFDLARAEYQKHVERYDTWLSRGFHGTMEYLKRGRDRRADPTLVLPGAKSILVVCVAYERRPQGETDSARGPRFARYLRGRDYHDVIAERLEQLASEVIAESPPGQVSYKVCVDTSAILERAWAAMAGLGWIGKNTLLIHPTEGSYLFIGSVLWNQATAMFPDPLPDWCGRCERCLKACPTEAIVAPRDLDARRCISYWTLEERGVPSRLTAEERARQGVWVAGCDLCQEICPFNLKPSTKPLPRDEEEAVDSPALSLTTWESLRNESEDDYRRRVKGTALSRVKPPEIKRNLEIAWENARKHDNPPSWYES